MPGSLANLTLRQLTFFSDLKVKDVSLHCSVKEYEFGKLTLKVMVRLG